MSKVTEKGTFRDTYFLHEDEVMTQVSKGVTVQGEAGLPVSIRIVIASYTPTNVILPRKGICDRFVSFRVHPPKV